MEKKNIVPILEKAIDIMEYLGAAPDPVSQPELQKALHIPQATCYRIVTTLVERGWLEKRGAKHFDIAAGLAAITEKTGNFVYSTEAAYIGDDGYAYAYDQKYDWEGYRITVQRYGQDGVLESTRQNVNVVLSYFRNYDCFDKGFVILRGDEMYGVEKSYGFSENYWYARSYDGTGVFISNVPDWLFTSVQDVTVEADTDYDLTATMHQQVRQLTLVIEPTGDAADRIESIEGSLSGAAGTMDFATGTYGAASDVALHFTRISEGNDAGKWTATVRLLGITGSTQTLTATLTYSNGNPADTGLESDLTAALADFNADKTEPLTLGGTIAETPTEAGVEAGITDWEKIDGGGVDAEM